MINSIDTDFTFRYIVQLIEKLHSDYMDEKTKNKSRDVSIKEKRMHEGKVKWFNNAKGYGFIIEEGESEDLFAHFSAVQMEGYKTLKAGQRVKFEKQPSDKGVHAVNIVPLDTPSRKQSPQEADSESASRNEHSETAHSH